MNEQITEVFALEKKLAELFDYQRFENNPRMAKLISETEARTEAASELGDEALSLVSAAGELIPEQKKDPLLPPDGSPFPGE